MLTFDELPPAEFPVVETTFIPYGYGGFEWVQMGYYDQDGYNAYFGTSVAEPSAPSVAFNNDHPVNGYLGIRWLGEGTIDFVGAEFASWSPANIRVVDMRIDGYNDGGFVGSATVIMRADVFTWQDAGLNGVDELRFYPANPIGHFSYDNFTFNGGEPVPDAAATAMLLALATAGLGLLRRRLA